MRITAADVEGISVVIPAFNEEQAIGEVVGEVSELCTAEGIDFEIIVVDDGSTDQTSETLQSKAVTLRTGAMARATRPEFFPRAILGFLFSMRMALIQ